MDTNIVAERDSLKHRLDRMKTIGLTRQDA
jgi:hypothetical protein